MSAPVDVLAVMDRAVSAVEAYTRDTVYVGGDAGFVSRVDDRGLREARAAVAELIEAAKAAEARLESVARTMGGSNFTDRHGDGLACARAASNLRAALARVTP